MIRNNRAPTSLMDFPPKTSTPILRLYSRHASLTRRIGDHYVRAKVTGQAGPSFVRIGVIRQALVR